MPCCRVLSDGSGEVLADSEVEVILVACAHGQLCTWAALHMGILLASLALALFALIAIKSGGLTYAGLLGLSLDIVWFILFTNKIRGSWCCCGSGCKDERDTYVDNML